MTAFGLDPGLVAAVPPMDAVVCHGDACNPNFMLAADGTCSGYIDLGSLGVTDRWADLAPALQSLEWNFGDGWQAPFLASYGIPDDRAKREFYTRVWNAVGNELSETLRGTRPSADPPAPCPP